MNSLQVTIADQNMQPAYRYKDNIFLNSTKVDSLQKDLYLFFYEIISAAGTQLEFLNSQ
jgi:hypothetical protein